MLKVLCPQHNGKDMQSDLMYRLLLEYAFGSCFILALNFSWCLQTSNLPGRQWTFASNQIYWTPLLTHWTVVMCVWLLKSTLLFLHPFCVWTLYVALMLSSIFNTFLIDISNVAILGILQYWTIALFKCQHSRLKAVCPQNNDRIQRI